jgi:uroporphyrin-III C-methyltransferase / precorrin-2 dehydrogenase / sirohydrochlorin ferrochelatase
VSLLKTSAWSIGFVDKSELLLGRKPEPAVIWRVGHSCSGSATLQKSGHVVNALQSSVRGVGGGVVERGHDQAAMFSLEQLASWRRDVRRFRPAAVPAPLVRQLLQLADLAPSVGNSQPWRIVDVASIDRRAAVRISFEHANAAAASLYATERGARYRALKLAGFDTAPAHLAVFCDRGAINGIGQGGGLGAQTMPEAYDYSCACMIMLLWLAAREQGLGLGWVSIVDPAAVARALDVPPEWKFVGYLLLGWPEEEHLDPELERHQWQNRTALADRLFQR